MKAWVEKGAWISKSSRKKLARITHDSVRKILVIRHAALGDMLQTRPFLVECRRFFPKAHITLALISNYQLGAPIDLVDQVVVIPGRDQPKINWFDLLRIYRRMGSFDLLFDLACTSRSLMQSFLTSARFKMGFPYRPKFFLFDVEIFRSEFNFEAELLLHFLSLLGHQSNYPVTYKLSERTIPLQERNHQIGYFLSSSNPHRNYPEAKFLEIILKLSESYPHYEHVIIQGNQAHERFEDLFQELSEKRKVKNVFLRKPTPLAELQIFLEKLKYLVSNDTGVRHMAIALDTAGIGIFSITIPFRNRNVHDPKQLCIFEIDGSWPSSVRVLETIQEHWRSIGI